MGEIRPKTCKGVGITWRWWCITEKDVGGPKAMACAVYCSTAAVGVWA